MGAANGAPRPDQALTEAPTSVRAPLELVVVREENTTGDGATTGTTRRTMVVRGLLLVAGAFGAGIAATKASERDDGKAAALPVDQPLSLSLVVPDVRFASPTAEPGKLPDGRLGRVPHGRLVDTKGRTVGDFSAALLPGSGDGMELQRFVFEDGTIFGVGSGGLDGSEYAVTGGTGRYAGVTGSYVARLNGKNAELDFRLRR